jgi:endoribonuclease Dicer
MARFCSALPEDRLLHGANHHDAFAENERTKQSYTIQSTGATLTYHSALAVLAYYASSLVRITFP